MSFERWVSPQNDQEILANVRKLIKKFPDMEFGLNSNFTAIDKSNIDGDYARAINKSTGYSIYRASFTLGINNIIMEAGAASATHLVRIKGNQDHNHRKPHEGQENFAVEVLNLFGSPPSSGALPGIDSIAAAGFAKVESALAGAVDRFAEMQTSFQEKNQQLRDEHEKTVAELRLEIEGEKSALQSEISQQRDELSAAQKLIDDRSNTHARRAIRTELKDSITDSLSQPSFAKNAEGKRLFVRATYLIAIAILCVFVWLSIDVLNSAVTANAPSAIWVAGIKGSISSISAIGLILLYLRWETQWLNQQANFERVLSSTKVDIDRASWVAESLLEWNRESPGKEIPSELLQSFTRRLFDWDGKVEDHHSAQDSLASAILGSAAKLQIGPNGANIELDKKGIQKLDNV